jgi:hypothetical protein
MIEKLFSDNKLFGLILEHYKKNANSILLENSLLVSRWARFCRTSTDIAKYTPIFRHRQLELKEYYADNVQRYERLYSIHLKSQQSLRAQEVQIN